jgi:hypothetical protein
VPGHNAENYFLSQLRYGDQMGNSEEEPLKNLCDRSCERRWFIRYSILTCAIFLPLFWAFFYLRNVYPIASWTVMMASGELQRGHTYFVLRGETISGETVDIQAIDLTNALYSRNWTMVNATVMNGSFKLASLHPSNAALLTSVGGIENLPPGARVPDLLESWGQLYNSKQSALSPRRLKAIRLDMYRWEGGRYADYDKFIDSWRKEL